MNYQDLFKKNVSNKRVLWKAFEEKEVPIGLGAHWMDVGKSNYFLLNHKVMNQLLHFKIRILLGKGNESPLLICNQILFPQKIVDLFFQ